MGYFDYQSLAQLKVGFVWIDTRKRIKSTMALALSQNITEYWMAELSNYRIDSTVKNNFEEAMSWAEESELNAVIISTLGVSYSLHTNFIDELTNFFKDVRIAETSVVGHVLDRGDMYYELHPQTFMVNVNWWKRAGRPGYGSEINKPQTLPDVIRSSQNWHDEYTPHWIRKNDQKTRKFKGLSRGWALIHAALEDNQTVHSWNKKLRESKFYLYPEVEQDTHKKMNWIFRHMQCYRWFMANTERLVSFDFNREDVDGLFTKFDGAFCTAGGISPLITAYGTKLAAGDKLVVGDYSPFALIMAKRIHQLHPKFEDYAKTIREEVDKLGTGDPLIVSDLTLAHRQLDRMQQLMIEQDGLKDYYENVWPHINVQFRTVDFLNPEDIEWLWKYEFQGRDHVYVNLSNVYTYQNSSWMFNIKERYDLQRMLIEAMYKYGPDKYYVKCARHYENNWWGECVSSIIENDNMKLPETIIERCPWLT